jgi:hypothetical protein
LDFPWLWFRQRWHSTALQHPKVDSAASFWHCFAFVFWRLHLHCIAISTPALSRIHGNTHPRHRSSHVLDGRSKHDAWPSGLRNIPPRLDWRRASQPPAIQIISPALTHGRRPQAKQFRRSVAATRASPHANRDNTRLPHLPAEPRPEQTQRRVPRRIRRGSGGSDGTTTIRARPGRAAAEPTRALARGKRAQS